MTVAPAAETTTTTTPARFRAPLDRFLPVEIRSMSAAAAMLRDGSILVRVTTTAEIAYTIRKLFDDRTGEHVLLARPVSSPGPWRTFDPAWQLPATIIYTPQNNEE